MSHKLKLEALNANIVGFHNLRWLQRQDIKWSLNLLHHFKSTIFVKQNQMPYKFVSYYYVGPLLGNKKNTYCWC